MRSSLCRAPLASIKGGVGGLWTTEKGSTTFRRCCPHVPKIGGYHPWPKLSPSLPNRI